MTHNEKISVIEQTFKEIKYAYEESIKSKPYGYIVAWLATTKEFQNILDNIAENTTSDEIAEKASDLAYHIDKFEAVLSDDILSFGRE